MDCHGMGIPFQIGGKKGGENVEIIRLASITIRFSEIIFLLKEGAGKNRAIQILS